MGTISDKLMRIINTKEDIRQALISKGYDVPTSIPFKEYAKMISDLPCRVDSFPDIEGIVARYSALGLTNEQMAANPVWVDKTGNGHDLQMKNFSWKGMSGCGGYSLSKEIFSYTPAVYSLNFTDPSVSTKEYDVYFQLIGLDENSGVFFNLDVRESGTAKRIKRETYTKDGIYHFEYKSEDDTASLYMIGYNGDGGDRTTFTVKILPYYAGALVFDGVDDYGACDNFPILTKEKGYTVVALRQWITYNPNAISAIATNASDQSFNGAFTFENYNKGAEQTISYGATQISLQYSKSPFSWQTTSKYNGVNIANGNKDATNSLVLGRSYPQRNEFANFAIWELVFLDHDATEEELTKIKDYFIKTYPWLFPDQAWTVTGKTNEDEDRATIANITGNGNDLVLSNFDFAEGSGYGLYGQNYISYAITNRAVYTKTNSSIHVTKSITAGVNFTESARNVTIPSYRIKVTGIQSGQEMIYRGSNNTFLTNIPSDGIYVLPAVENGSNLGFQFVSYTGDCDITIEQIPEYEGYLVTDGVDDIASSNTVVYEADFTFIGEWKFIQKDDTVAGINSVSHLYIQNRYNRGATVMINSTFENKENITDYMTFKAITSKGKAYDENWNEVDLLYGDGNKGLSQVSIGGQGGSDFCHMIFKNMALYMNKVFSKDDCVKAYNYLQTLKSK